MQQPPQWSIHALAGGYDITQPDSRRFTVSSDGSICPAPDLTAADSVSLEHVGDRRMDVLYKKNGRLVQKYVFSVSEDNAEMTVHDGHLTLMWYRSPRTTGEHDPFVDTWVLDVQRSFDQTLPINYEPVGETGVRYFQGNGGTFWARADGRAYQSVGMGFATVSLKWIDANTVEEFRKIGDSGSETARFVVSPDRRRMTVIHEGVFDAWHYKSERLWKKR